MTNATPALDMRNATMDVIPTALGMFTLVNVSMGVWGDVYGGLTWPVLSRMEDFSHAADDAADDMRHYGRHEP